MSGIGIRFVWYLAYLRSADRREPPAGANQVGGWLSKIAGAGGRSRAHYSMRVMRRFG